MRCLLVAALLLAPISSGQAPPGADLEGQLLALKDRPEELWLWLNDFVMKLYDTGQYKRALEAASINLDLARKLYPRTHPRMVTTLGNLGQMYVALARYDEGEPYLWEAFSRALEAKRTDADLVALANNLADCQVARGKAQDAIGLYEKALRMNHKLGRGDTTQQAVILDNLGQAYLGLGEFDKALGFFQDAIAIQSKYLSVADPDFAETISHIAALHVSRGDLTRAEGYFERLIGIYRDAQGSSHPNVARSMKDLAHVYTINGRHDEASHLMHHALQIMESAFGKDHPNVADYLHEAGLAKLAALKDEEAEDYFTRALAAIDKIGPDTPSAANIADGLASAEIGLGKLAEAEAHASRALVIVEKTLPPGSPLHFTVLSTLATALLKQDRFAEAERLNRRIIDLAERDPSRAQVLESAYHNQIAILRHLGREKDAQTIEQKLLALAGKGLPRS